MKSDINILKNMYTTAKPGIKGFVCKIQLLV